MSEQQPRLYPLVELVKTRLREFFREPAIVFWVFGFPLLMAIGLGAAFRSKEVPKPLVAVVVAEDASENKIDWAKKLVKSDKLDASLKSKEQAHEALKRSRIDLIVSINPTETNYHFDPKKESGPIARMMADNVLQNAAGRKDLVQTTDSLVTEIGSRYIDFLIPGLIGLNLMGSSMWGIGLNIVVARKRRLLRRYAVTPMRRTHFLLSYLVSRSLFLVFELTLLVSFGRLMFGTVVQGSYFALALMATLGAAAYAGIGLLVAARVSTTETASGWLNFVQMPMYVLSGAFFSYERFPEWMHTPVEMLPLTALVNALRAIYNEGATLSSLAPEITVLGLWASVSFFVALRWFKWQ